MLTTVLTPLASTVLAQDVFVIDSTVATTNDGNTLDGDDSITITESGAIDFDGAGADVSGLEGTGGGNALTNDGAITIDNSRSGFAFYVTGDDNTLTNTGAVNLDSNNGSGALVLFESDSNGNTLINSGEITIDGGNRGYAARLNNGNSVENTGNIDIQARDNSSIFEFNDGNTITNTGSVELRTSGSLGYFADGRDDNTVINHGDVFIRARGPRAIELRDNNTVENTGRIESTAINTAIRIIYFTGDGNTLVNSGELIAGDGSASKYSIYVEGVENTIDLRAGSVLVGDLYFANADNTLKVGRGLNMALNIDTTAGVMPNIVAASGGGFAVVGGAVVSADATSFLAGDHLQVDLSGQVLDAVASASAGRGAAIATDYQNVQVLSFNAREAEAAKIWGKTFFHYSDSEETDERVAYQTKIGGLVVGYESQMLAGELYFGGALSSQDGKDRFETDSWHLFAGYKTGASFGAVDLEGELTVGVARTDQVRTFTDGGSPSELTSDYFSAFVTPSVTVSTDLDPSDASELRPSLRLSTTAVFTESYEERGGAYALDVDARHSQSYEARAQAERGVNWGAIEGYGELDGAEVSTSLRLGADFQFLNGDDVSTTVAGQPLDISQDDETEVRLFVGADLKLARSDGFELDANVEAGRSNQSRSDVRAGLKATFSF
ncbi:MAG: autotransporter domain-containing protein [Pseudomonadota bacterium]